MTDGVDMLLVGAAVMLPMILGYTGYVSWANFAIGGRARQYRFHTELMMWFRV